MQEDRVHTRHFFLIMALALLLLTSSGCARFYNQRVADSEGKHVQCAFTCPKGDAHQILLGVPRSRDNEPFAGEAHITTEDGKPVCDFPFTADTTQRGNWLDEYGLTGHILTWNEEGWKQAQPGKLYVVVLDYTQAPPEGSSVWVTWVK